MTAKFFEYLHRHAGLIKRAFFIVLILAVVFDFFIERHEALFIGDRIYGFWSVFGLAGCLMMIFLCKWLSRVWLKKDENYYDD